MSTRPTDPLEVNDLSWHIFSLASAKDLGSLCKKDFRTFLLSGRWNTKKYIKDAMNGLTSYMDYDNDLFKVTLSDLLKALKRSE